MTNIKTKQSKTVDSKYHIILNGSYIGQVIKEKGIWTASTDSAGMEHIVHTSKTKKDAVATWVHKYLTDGREGY